VAAAVRRRAFLRVLAEKRDAAGLSQNVAAARMGTSQSAVARLESAVVDAKFSTVERYEAAIGQRVEFTLCADEFVHESWWSS